MLYDVAFQSSGQHSVLLKSLFGDYKFEKVYDRVVFLNTFFYKMISKEPDHRIQKTRDVSLEEKLKKSKLHT